MKRIVIALILLVLVTGLSIAALWQQAVVTDQLLTSCDELISIYESGDIPACRRASERFFNNLEERMTLFPFFLRHERIETIYQQAAAIPHLIDDNDPADFLSAVSSVRMQLKILMDNEWPTPQNIL